MPHASKGTKNPMEFICSMHKAGGGGGGKGIQ